MKVDLESHYLDYFTDFRVKTNFLAQIRTLWSGLDFFCFILEIKLTKPIYIFIYFSAL